MPIRLLEEIEKIIQGKRALAEFHCEVSKVLILALTKIGMESSGDNLVMQLYATQEAVGTSIIGYI